MKGTTVSDSSAMVTFSHRSTANITARDVTDVASGKSPLMTRFSIAYASTSTRYTASAVLVVM
jgi:hypothetical protein